MKNLILDFDVMRNKYSDVELQEIVYKSKYQHKVDKEWAGYEKVIDMLDLCFIYSMDLGDVSAWLVDGSDYKYYIAIKDKQLVIVYKSDGSYEAMSLKEHSLYSKRELRKNRSIGKRIKEIHYSDIGSSIRITIYVIVGITFTSTMICGITHKSEFQKPKEETTVTEESKSEITGVTFEQSKDSDTFKASVLKEESKDVIPAGRKITGAEAKLAIDKYKDSSKVVVIKVNDDYIYSESEGIFGNKFTGTESLVLLEDGSYYTADTFEDFVEKGQKIPVIKDTMTYIIRDIKNNRTGKQIGFCIEEE